jgi:hypothetical protein
MIKKIVFMHEVEKIKLDSIPMVRVEAGTGRYDGWTFYRSLDQVCGIDGLNGVLVFVPNVVPDEVQRVTEHKHGQTPTER